MAQVHRSVNGLVLAIPFLWQRRAARGAHLDARHAELLANVLYASLLRVAQLVTEQPERFRPVDIAADAARIISWTDSAIDRPARDATTC